MCAPSRLANLEESALQIIQEFVVNKRTLMCKNYSMSRTFDSGRPKEDFDIRVIGVIEKAESNQLGFQSYDEVIYLACVSRAYPGLLYEDLLSGIRSRVIEVVMIYVL